VEDSAAQPLRVCAQPRNAVPAARCCRAGRWGLGAGRSRRAGLEPGGWRSGGGVEDGRTPSAAVGRSVEDALGGGS
jgi:hypothetical protein